MMYKSNHYAVPFSLYSAAYQLHFFKTGQKNHKHNTKKKKKQNPPGYMLNLSWSFSLWICVELFENLIL